MNHGLLPTLRQLYQGGVYGELESIIPAITVPAWSAMMSSKDPGTLGIYGFRNRRDYSYDNLYIATGDYVKEPRLWDILGEAGKQVALVGVPQTFPIKPVNGKTVEMVGLIWHFGCGCANPGATANKLTPHIGDANTMIPEYKAFLVNIEKV